MRVTGVGLSAQKYLHQFVKIPSILISSIKTYFFFFNLYIHFSKRLNIKLSILHYIILKYQIFICFNCLFFFTHNNHHSLSSFSLGICKERIKNYIQVNSVNINLQNLFSNFANLHNFSMTDMSDFGI